MKGVPTNHTDTNTHDAASILLVNPEGMLILQKRDDKPGIRSPNKVTAWGGACEGSESPLHAAVREIREETNLRPNESDLEFFGVYPRDYKIGGKQVVNYAFVIHDVDERALEVYEGQGYVLADPQSETTDPLYTKLVREMIADYNSRAV